MATVNSARSNFRDAVTVPAAADAKLTALANVECHIYAPGTTNPVNVYGSRNPADVVPLANPIVTDATGIINFWAEPGEYDLAFHDRNAPARIADQTRGWSALSPINKGIPSAAIRDDAGLVYGSKDPINQRQDIPLGGIIDWWRPSATYDAGAGAGNPPPGFAYCDGSTVAAGNHDFGGGAIVLPNLINKFTIGADITKADGTASTSSAAPGIRGVGGSHTSLVPAHYHNPGTLSIDATTGDHPTLIQGSEYTNSGGLAIRMSPIGVDSSFIFTVDDWRARHGHGLLGLIGATGGVNGDFSTSIDARPAHVGVLKIMKIRRN